MSIAPLILASGSPRRRQLLEEMGVKFEVVHAPVAELDAASAPALAPAELAIENGRLKAAAGVRLKPGRWVLGADTVVVLDGRLFGKPSTLAHAREFLRTMGGRTHEVITGGVLLSPEGAEESFHDVSEVTFRALSEEVIAHYLEQVDVFDKAGGYALQERSETIVAGVEGSWSNVIGLPAEKLAPLLRSHGLL